MTVIPDLKAAVHLTAMSLDIPETPGHPNKRPFSGILTRIDEPSDGAPGGSGGRKVIITKACVEASIPTLLGMGVDCNGTFTDHAEAHKIGVITEANIEGNALVIAGHFYAKDFPREMAAIDKEKSKLGFSYEFTPTNAVITTDNMLKVEAGIFTGAALLYKSKAAYKTTSLAAGDSQENDEMDLAKLIEAVAALTAAQEKTNTDLAALTKTISEQQPDPALKASLECRTMVEPHAAALDAAADAMKTAGIGSHATRGHVKILQSMAGSMRASAAMGKIPHIIHEHEMLNASEEDTDDMAIDKETKAQLDALTASSKTTAEALAAITTTLADLKAKQRTESNPPERKTLSANITALLAKHNLTPDGGDISKIDTNALSAALKASGMPAEERMVVINTVHRAANGKAA